METAFQSMEVMQAMLKDGLQNSLSDAGVGVLCARTAVIGAYFNVRINAKDIKNREFAEKILAKAASIYKQTIAIENDTIAYIDSKM
jgi:glutamate formiminotransferase/formiminotetrahydrofolate cyclodeaminase